MTTDYTEQADQIMPDDHEGDDISGAETKPLNGWRSDAELTRIVEMRRQKAINHFLKISEGLMDRSCPICNYQGVFSPVRHKVDVWCPSCDSRSRHRLLQLWINQTLVDAPVGATLHFAAETCLQDAFRAVSGNYVTADLEPNFDLQLNIEQIDQPDASYDLVIANHVLEHVDDTKALKEIARILRPGGRVLLTVPMIEGWTTSYEDPGYLSPEMKRLVMSDPDHRRWYGRDIKEKIEAAGFAYSEFTAHEPNVTTYGLARAEKIFIGQLP